MSARARSGMTLMELVIGLAITGMMAAAGAATFASVIDHRETLRGANATTERAVAMRDMLHSWLEAGTIQIQRGGGPRGSFSARGTLTSNGRSTGINATNGSAAAAAQAAGDELRFTTNALNPAFVPNTSIRLYIDADPNTPEHGLTIEYQPNFLQPIVRKMLDSTIGVMTVEYLDSRTNRWLSESEGATIIPSEYRVTFGAAQGDTISPILQVPMMFEVRGISIRTFR